MAINGIESLNGNDYYSSTLDLKYDFNNDGKVDITDYQVAKLTLDDEDPTNDIDISNEELNRVFATIIDKEDSEVAEDLTERANNLLESL